MRYEIYAVCLFSTFYYEFLHFSTLSTFLLHIPITFQRTWSERTLVCNIMGLRSNGKKTVLKLF